MSDSKLPTLAELKDLLANYLSETQKNPYAEQFDYLEKGAVLSSTDLSGWETSLTEPDKHNDQKFCYLVHAVKDKNSGANAIQQRHILEDMIRDPSIKFNSIDLLKEPHRISEKSVISSSLIDENHCETWTAGGYILRAPLDNILKTASEDIGTNFVKGEETAHALYQERNTKGIASPERVLGYTSANDYNKIVLAGTGRTGKKVEISGVFVKVFPDGSLVDDELTYELRRIAYRNNWPIIEISEPVMEYSDSKPEAYAEKIFGLQKKGIRYSFDIERQSFEVYQYGGKKSRLMTPAERRKFLALTKEYLTQNPDETIEKLVIEAEKIPDSTLQQRIENQMRYEQRQRDPFSTHYKTEQKEFSPEIQKYLDMFEPYIKII